MAMLAWNPSWETGVPEIDRQHRMWLAQVEKLFQAIVGRQEPAAICDVLMFLASYVDSHFRLEERFMERSAYPGFAAHKAVHDELRSKVASLIEAHNLDPASLTDEITDFLSGWLIRHIDEHDRAMARHLKKACPKAPELMGEGANSSEMD